MRFAASVLLAVVALAAAAPVSAQLVAAKDGPIVYGHHHVNATSLDEHKKFWVTAIGGTLVRVGTDNREIVKFHNALLFMRAQKPTGGTEGSTFDHVGLSVPNLRQVVDRIKANGYRMVTSSRGAGEHQGRRRYRRRRARPARQRPGLRHGP